MNAIALIAIDWGTSAARAYALDGGGRILAERAALLGIAQVDDNAFAAALAALLGDWASLPVPRIASGMIGSRQGWVEVPYLECPAALDSLAAGLRRTPGGEIAIVPGVIGKDAAGVPDVMRGEETQILGALGPEEAEQVVVLPGTHSKWARIDRGRIVGFSTWMTGELFGVLLQHSLLGRLATPSGDASDGEAFARGVEHGLREPGLSHAIFGARTLALTGALAPNAVGDWLSGVLIGHEIASARAQFCRPDGRAANGLRIVGSDALTQHYLRAFALAGLAATTGPANAAPRGLYRIACQAELIR